MVRGCTAIGNGRNGINADTNCVVIGNTVSENGVVSNGAGVGTTDPWANFSY